MPHQATRIIVLLGCLASILASACGGHAATSRSPTATISCLPVADRAATRWEQVRPLGSGGFPPEAGSNDRPQWEPGRWPLTLQPVIGFHDNLWMLSQTHAWSSRDGVNWTHYQKTDSGERIWHEYVFFANRLWLFGGLRYADRVPLNDVWSSPDGVMWQYLGNADWSPRKGHRIIVFHDQLWLFGGADRVQHDFSTTHALNDVWSSDDGLHWTQRVAAAAWAPREEAQVVVFNDALYLLGGQGQADVWRSADGVTWTQLSAEAAWQPRSGYGTAVFGDQLWVYGGVRGSATNALNDIWYSADGRTWAQQTEHAPWAPRSPKTIVYKARLWIFSGKHTGGPDNFGGDIWTMSAARAPCTQPEATVTPRGVASAHVDSPTAGLRPLPAMSAP